MEKVRSSPKVKYTKRKLWISRSPVSPTFYRSDDVFRNSSNTPQSRNSIVLSKRCDSILSNVSSELASNPVLPVIRKSKEKSKAMKKEKSHLKKLYTKEKAKE